MRKKILGISRLVLAVGFLAVCTMGCSKDTRPRCIEEPSSVKFSAYTGGMATKAVSVDAGTILGRWDDSGSTFIPGTGIGVFAFYQKAKSNGYPSDFNKNIGEPEFMYNQKVERTTDGVNFKFEYSPKKYWPNSTNDQLSFFAYAPYDETAVWEDLQRGISLNGDKISRTFVVKDKVENQTDFLWADPVLNVMKPSLSGTIDFSFSHLCTKLGFRLGVDESGTSSGTPTAWTDPNTVITVRSVTVHNIYEKFTYTICWDAVNSVWEPSYSNIEGRQDIILKNVDGMMQNAQISSETYTDASFRQLNSPEGWMMLAPQRGLDLTFSYAVTTTENGNESVVINTCSAHVDVLLEAGKAYMVNFLISPSRVTILSADVVNWDYEEDVSNVVIP